MSWPASLSSMIAAVAFSCAAAALFKLFSSARTKVLGPARWFVAGTLGLVAALQVAALLAARQGMMPAAMQLNLLSASCLLLVGIGLWPFLAHMNKSLAHSISRKLQRQLNRAEAEALETRRWLVQAEEVAHVGHWHYLIETKTLTWSDEIYRIHGLSKADYKPDVAKAIEFYHPDERGIIAESFRNAVEQQKPYEVSARLVRPNGEVRHVISRAAAQLGADGNPVSVFGVFLDVTEQKQIEEKLRTANQRTEQMNTVLKELALVDALTGLPNRRHLDATMDAEFRRAAREGSSLGLIMIDLDRFKGFNDFYGHPAGDECLRKVAAAIANVPQRPGDLVARYGGEEIAVLLPGATKIGAEMIAHRITNVVRELGLEHKGNPEKVVTVSCGVAVFRHAADALLPLNLIEHADQALYEAKLCGRNRVSTYAERALTAH